MVWQAISMKVQIVNILGSGVVQFMSQLLSYAIVAQKQP